MADTFYSKYFRFTKSGSTGTQAVSGVGFRGKALLVWTTFASGAMSGAEMSLGMADSATQAVRCINLPNGESANGKSSQAELLTFVVLRSAPVALGDGPQDSNGFTTVPSTAPWITARASLGGFTDDGFTLDWDINDGDSASIVHAIVIGGDIRVKVAAVKVNVTYGDSINVTGLGFEPDSYIVMGGTFDEFNTGTTDVTGPPGGSMHGFGFSNASENVCGWALGHGRPYGGINASGQHVDRVVSIRAANLSTADELVGGQITASGPDGFTFTRTVGFLTHQPYQYVMCLRGAKFKLGSFVVPTNTTAVATITTGFAPSTVIFQTDGSVNGSITGSLDMMLGAWQAATDSAAEDAGGTRIGGTPQPTPTVTRRSSYSGYAIQHAAVVTGTVDFQGSVSAVSSTTVSVKMTVASAGTRNILYMAIGPYEEHLEPDRGISGSAVFGVTTTVRVRRAVAFGLDDEVNEHNTEGQLKVFGDVHVTGDLVGVMEGNQEINDLSDVVITAPVLGQLVRHNGTTWVNSGPTALFYPLTDPTIAAPTTWVNQGGASVSISGPRVFLRAPASSTNNVRARVKSAPAVPYKITIAAFASVLHGAASQQSGVCFRQSSSGRLFSLHVNGGAISNGNNGLMIGSWSGPTAAPSASANLFYAASLGGLLFLRIADNGTVLVFSYSVDGYNFIELYRVLRTSAPFIPDQVGYFANSADNRMDVGLDLRSWRESA